MSEYALEAKGVTKVYEAGEKRVVALSDVNLQVKRGEFVSIMGPSGSGKTTLLNILGCLDKPTSGQVVIDGLDVTTMRENELPKTRAEKIGFIFQNFNLIPTLSALENVELPMWRGRIPRDQRRSRALKLLESVGLSERENHRPHRLSAGEQQRVAIARALANNPAIVLADEPTGNLDVKNKYEIVRLLGKLNIDQKTTVIMITHDSQMASQTERILFLNRKLLAKEKQGAHLMKKKMVCPKCGYKIQPTDSTCPRCGKRIW